VVDFDELVIAEQISRAGLQRIKFAECLPEEVAMRVLERRFDARADARQTADEIIHELRNQVL
jgi:hypothetical protein